MTAKLLIFAAAVAFGWVAAEYAKDPVPPLYEIRALTLDGHMYVLGRGDTCKDAWIGTDLSNKPHLDNWVRIDCEAAS